MNNEINIVLPYSSDGWEDWCFEGPIYHNGVVHQSHTIFPELKPNCRNYILIEPYNTIKGIIENINRNIKGNILSEFIKNNDVKLIISVVGDPIQQDAYLELMDLLNQLEIGEKTQIITSTLNITGNNVYSFNFFIEETGLRVHHTFHGNINELGYVGKEPQLNELDNFRNKKFICFNRTINKPHRFSVLHDYLTNDFKDSYFTFLNLDEIHCQPYQKDMFDEKVYLDFIPLELDTNGKKYFGVSDTIKKELFIDSCINLVTESSFERNELFLSEKILKPILTYQPFIVYGPVNYLKALRDMGFKTFSDFWDETYDTIEDPEKRYFEISNLVLGLNKKSIEEFNQIYKETKEIVLYNNSVLRNMKKDSISDFFKNL